VVTNRYLRCAAIAVSAFLGLAISVVAQDDGPRFDAVSVRRVEASGGGRGATTRHVESGRVELHRYSLLGLVTLAYKTSYFQVTWPTKDHEAYYDVQGVMPSNTSEEQRDLMLQNMLRDRLTFRAHHEVRPVPSFVLLVSPKGLKLAKAQGPSDPSDSKLGRIWIGPSEFSLKGNVAMTQLTELFSTYLNRPFVDMTGLHGYYGVQLSIPRDSVRPDPSVSVADYTPEMLKGLNGWDDSRFIAAMEKQAGLTVVPRSIATDVLVVDSFHLDPTEN